MLQSIAKFLINPLLYVWIGLLVLLFLKNSRKKYLLILNIFFYLFTIPLTPYVFSRAWSVKDTFKPDVYYDAAVVLTGIVDNWWYKHNRQNLYDVNNYYRFTRSADKILAGITFVRSGHTKMILLGEFVVGSINEAKMLKEFALLNGLNSEQIQIYGRVNKTLDEAIGVRIFAKNNSLKKLLLITSEMHMRRALAFFNKQGLAPDVFSSNKMERDLNWHHLIPSPNGAQKTRSSLYELVGYIGYKLKGDL